MPTIKTIKERISISAGVANTLVDKLYFSADPLYPNDRTKDTAMIFTGYTWEMEIKDNPTGTGDALASATVTVADNNILATLDVADSNACVAGAIDGIVYADLLGAAAGEEPLKFVSLVISTDSTVTTWGA